MGIPGPMSGLQDVWVGAQYDKYSPLRYGAQPDGRAVEDATTPGCAGAGPCVVNSNTISFSSTDVGKALTIHAQGPGWSPYSGKILSVQSATQCTFQAVGAVSAIASNGALIVVSDSTTAFQTAAANVKAENGILVIPQGIFGCSAALDLGGGAIGGQGKAPGNSWAFPSGVNTSAGIGSQIIKILSYQSGAFITFSGYGARADGVSIDACKLNDYAVYATHTQDEFSDCTIGRGAQRALYVTGGSCLVRDSFIYGNLDTSGGNPVIMAPGDFMLKDSFCYGANAGQPTLYMNGAIDDFQIVGNHFYRAGTYGTLTQNYPGSHVQITTFAGSSRSGGVVNSNTFDTCNGNAVQLTAVNVGGAANNCDLVGIAIVGNQFYQPQSGFTDNTFSCVGVDIGNNSSNANVAARGLTITGNTGKGYFVPGAAGNRWASIVNFNVNATYGAIYGCTMTGNAVDGCVAAFTNSGAAYTPVTAATNVTINNSVPTTT